MGIAGKAKKIIEGRFPMPGEPARGLLGAIEKQWRIINDNNRGMGTTEQWLARALVRGLLETMGGTEEDGRFSLDLSSGGEEGALLAEVIQLREAVSATAGRVVELEGIAARDWESIQKLEQEVNLLSNSPFPEQLHALELRVSAEDVASLLKRIEALESTPRTSADTSPLIGVEERFSAMQKRLDAQDKLLNSLRGTVGNLKKPVAAKDTKVGSKDPVPAEPEKTEENKW